MAKRWRGLAPIGLLAFVSFAGCENDKATCPKDDLDPCTADLCEGGATLHEALPAGSVCHTGTMTGVCEGGVCVVSCASPKDCDDQNPCTADDCALPYKSCVHVADSSIQPPDDGNPCTWEGCSGGKVHSFSVSNNTPCGVGVCDGGVCSKCSTDAECGKNTPCVSWDCVSGACMATHTVAGAQVFSGDLKGDCRVLKCDGYGGIEQFLWEQDAPEDDNNACTKELCKGWTPVHELLGQGTFCAIPGGGVGVCRGDGACVQCTQNLHCGKAYCYQNECHSCENGLQDGDETGLDCGGSSCGSCLGDPCSQGSDCQSGFCADGVCCNTSCGTCHSCNLPGSVGLCDVLEKYAEDPPLCTVNSGKMCNGVGVCKTALGFACAGNFECASSKCVSGLCAGP